ncbi:MAG: response regulator [Verrucomicrobiota bacterium]
MARSPKLPTDAKETQPLPSPPPRKTKRMGRVLVVDDETAIVDAICEFLDLQNITTDKANDGAEALQLLSKNRYDAIISDIRMPGVDGPELYERAVAMDASYKTRFLFMSGDLVRDSTQGFVSLAQLPVPGQAVCAAGALPEPGAAPRQLLQRLARAAVQDDQPGAAVGGIGGR